MQLCRRGGLQRLTGRPGVVLAPSPHLASVRRISNRVTHHSTDSCCVTQLLTGIAVLFHHQPPATARRHTVDTDNLLADVIDDTAA